MRIIFFLWVICLFKQPALTQTPRPSQKEVTAQMQQAKTEAQKLIIEQENQIAEAKVKGESPETIKEMEDRLATMKKMLGVIDKAGTAGDTRPKTLAPPKTAEPKYVSPFVPVPLKQPVSAPTKEQAKDQLLWYTGRRIDANTLITASGMVVRYDRTNNRIIVQPDRRVDTPDHYYGLLNTLAQIPKMKNDFVVGVNRINNSFFMFPEIQKAYDEFNFFQARYYKIAGNTVDLPSPVPDYSLEIQHQLLVEYMALLPAPRAILPPKRPNDLCSCAPHSQDRTQYEFELTQWFQRFCHEEMGLLKLVEAIYVNITASGAQGNTSLTGTPNLKEDIIKAFNLVIGRLTQKLTELTNEYRSPDINIEEGLVLVTKYFQKLLSQTMGSNVQSTITLRYAALGVIKEIRGLILNSTVFEKYVQDQKIALNFNAVLNMSLYGSHELNRKILDESNEVDENVLKWYEKLDKFNRFVLSVKLDFEYKQIDPESEKPLLEANGKLESDYIIVTLARNDCDWRLELKDPDQSGRRDEEGNFQIPMNVINGTKIINIAGKILPYSGPAKMNMVFPSFKINLCPGGTNDKAVMDILRYSDADILIHKNDKADKVYTLDMLQYANKMLLDIKKTEINASNVTATAIDMIRLEDNTPMPLSTGNQMLDKIMMDYTMHQKKRDLQAGLTPISHTGNTIIPFDVKNGSSVLISKTHSTVDPAAQDYIWGIKMTRALITLKVDHSPHP